jgi:hypothetical protein
MSPVAGVRSLVADAMPHHAATRADTHPFAVFPFDATGGDDLKQAASQLVASALVLPAMSSLQQSPLRPSSGPFAANSVEKRFAPLLYERLADEIAQASNFNLVRAIVNRFEARA